MKTKSDWPQRVKEDTDRLDRWLHQRLPGVSMSQVREAIEAGRVLVNGQTAKKGWRLVAGNEVEAAELAALEAEGPALAPIATPGELVVAYEDEAVAVVEKPAGLPTHPLVQDEISTLVNLTLARYPETSGVGPHPLEPGLIHRLDAGTRGLVLIARAPAAYEVLAADLKKGRIAKGYRALVWGRPERDRGEIKVPLVRGGPKGSLMRPIGPGAKKGQALEAITRYRLIETAGPASLLELELLTGVTHQLRAHLAFIGHPVLGDDRYGDRPVPGSTDFALQAARLRFFHPSDGRKIAVRTAALLGLGDAAHWIEPADGPEDLSRPEKKD